MSGIGVVLNPHSRRYRRFPHRLSRMAFIVGERGHCKATESLDDLETVAHQFRDKAIDILALSGGDGTVHKTLTAFIHAYGAQPLPKIALLRGGTLNTVATCCGIHGSSEKLLLKVIYRYQEDQNFKTTTVIPMKINQEYGFIWGCGVINRFMEAYYASGRPSKVHAAWTLIRSISSALVNGRFANDMFAPFDAEVRCNDHVWPLDNYRAVFAGAVPELGLRFRVFYKSSEQTPIHAMAFTVPPRQVLRYVPSMFRGKPSGCPDLIEEGTTHMRVKLAQPMAYTIDGDMFEPCDTFDISCGPRLDVLVP